MSIGITYFKVKVQELEEDIGIHKDKFRKICDGEGLAFLQNKLKQFNYKL